MVWARNRRPKRQLQWSHWLAKAALALFLPLQMALPAAAQTGWWPWAGPQSPGPQNRPGPVPREPVYRPPGQQGVPAPIPQPPNGYGQSGSGNKAPICVQLEQKLVQEGQRSSSTREQLPRIESELRQMERANQVAQSQLERAECYDYWLFSKTLKRTRQCVDLAQQADGAKRKVAELDAQRQQIAASGGKSYLDDIYQELARNKCGRDYEREAEKRSKSIPFWQDEDTGPSGRDNQFGALPFATYRTVCVRLCDGYFFPVSFSTLRNHIERDVDVCQSKCAAPAELYYYQNPGSTMEQAVSARNQTPYTGLKTAFRFRKEFVQGCSCKQAEFTPSPADRVPDRKAEAPLLPGANQQVKRLP